MNHKTYMLIFAALAVLILAIAAPGQVRAQSVDSSGRLLAPYAYDSASNTPWSYQIGATTFTAANINPITMRVSYDKLDQSRYYSVGNYTNFFIPDFDINLNQGVNFTYTLRSGRTVQGWIYVYDLGDPFNYYVSLSNDGATITTKHGKLPFLPIALTFEIGMYNNSGIGQHGIGITAATVDCGMPLTPIAGASDNIISLYVVPLGTYYDTWNFVFSCPFRARITEYKGLYSTTNPDQSDYGTTNSLDPLGDIIKKINDMAGLIISVFNVFMVIVLILFTLVKFVLDPYNIVLLLLLLETGYTALITNTSKDIFTATKKFTRFQTSLYEFLMRAAALMVGFFYMVFDALVKLPDIILKAVSGTASLISQVIGYLTTLVLFFPK